MTRWQLAAEILGSLLFFLGLFAWLAILWLVAP